MDAEGVLAIVDDQRPLAEETLFIGQGYKAIVFAAQFKQRQPQVGRNCLPGLLPPGGFAKPFAPGGFIQNRLSNFG